MQFDALIRDLTTEFGLKAPTRASITKAFKLAQKNNPALKFIDKAPNVPKKPKRVVVNENSLERSNKTRGKSSERIK